MKSLVRKVGVMMVAVSLLFGFSTAQAAKTYKLIDLGSLDGRGQSYALDINNKGQVVGYSSAPGGQNRAFLWDNGRMTDLGTFDGTGYSRANAINDRGQVVGDVITSDGIHGFLWEKGRMYDIGSLGGGGTNAADINNKSQIVGQSTTALGESHAFVWQDGRMIDLGGPNNSNTLAHAINDSGIIVGTGYFPDDDANLPVVWKKGVLTRLPLAARGEEGAAYSVGSDGQIVGTSVHIGELAFGMVWSTKSVATIVVSKQKTDPQTVDAYDINTQGQIVGRWQSIAEQNQVGAYVWEKGQMTLLPNPGGYWSEAVAINLRGRIVGTAMLPDGREHAVMWIP